MGRVSDYDLADIEGQLPVRPAIAPRLPAQSIPIQQAVRPAVQQEVSPQMTFQPTVQRPTIQPVVQPTQAPGDVKLEFRPATPGTPPPPGIIQPRIVRPPPSDVVPASPPPVVVEPPAPPKIAPVQPSQAVSDNVEFEEGRPGGEGTSWDSGQRYDPEPKDEYSTELPVEDTFSDRQAAVIQETAPTKSESELDKFLSQFVASVEQIIPEEVKQTVRRFKFAGGRELVLPLDEEDILNAPQEFVDENLEQMRMTHQRDGVHRK